VAERYAAFQRLLAPLARRPVRVALSERRAWELHLDDGYVLELGRERMEERLQRFVSAYDRSLAQLPFRPYRVDLRYPNGFAVRAAAFAVRPGGA
jgi:cell division protein FtsQ